MRVLLASLYELGHQPLHVASPAGALREAGHDVRCLDLSVERWDPALADWAEAVALSVPMHTAMRLALGAAKAIRARRPGLPICLYGLYAGVSRGLTVPALADRVIAGEYEPALLAWVEALAGGAEPGAGDDQPVVQLARRRFALPARDLLPPLERYAHLALDGEERLVGYVEATHGCRHRCAHCPVPAVYDGTIRAVGRNVVVEDIAQLVSLGARHITFGDPDFLNAPTQALRVVRAMRERFGDLTFDCTTKVDHVLEHSGLWEELAASGCLFVVCALESVNDEILARLDKGHTTEQAAEAIGLLREHGIEVRPSFMPFTPWTTPRDVVDLLDFMLLHDLVDNVDPVQLTIRLLLPEGSLLLAHPDLAPHLKRYDPERLSWSWSAEDPAVDELQARLAALAEQAAASGEPARRTFARIREVALEAAGLEQASGEVIAAGSVEGRPRLTEPWFC